MVENPLENQYSLKAIEATINGTCNNNTSILGLIVVSKSPANLTTVEFKSYNEVFFRIEHQLIVSKLVNAIKGVNLDRMVDYKFKYVEMLLTQLGKYLHSQHYNINLTITER